MGDPADQLNGRRPLRDWVALTLAVGIVTAVNFVAFGVVYDAIASQGPGLSDNATQILTSAFAGGFGVIGSYIGFKYGSQSNGGTAGRP